MLVNMSLSFELIRKLLHSYSDEKRSITQTSRTVFREGQILIIAKRIALSWNFFRFIQVGLTMICLSLLTDKSFTAGKTQLCKFMTHSEFLSVAAVYVISSLWGWFSDSDIKLALALHERWTSQQTCLSADTSFSHSSTSLTLSLNERLLQCSANRGQLYNQVLHDLFHCK